MNPKSQLTASGEGKKPSHIKYIHHLQYTLQFQKQQNVENYALSTGNKNSWY